MSSISITDNIAGIEENMKKLNDQALLIQQELIRLSGSLRVFKVLQEAGVENIPLPKDEVTNREVMDNLD